MPAKPQDRKEKIVKEFTIRPEETPGWDLMKPIDEIPVWDQIPLVSMLQDALKESEQNAKEKFEDDNARRVSKGLEPLKPRVAKDDKGKVIRDDAGEPIEIYERDFDISIIGKLAQGILPYAKDEAELTKFLSGKGALNRTADLAMAWVGQMGESSSSDDN